MKISLYWAFAANVAKKTLALQPETDIFYRCISTSWKFFDIAKKLKFKLCHARRLSLVKECKLVDSKRERITSVILQLWNYCTNIGCAWYLPSKQGNETSLLTYGRSNSYKRAITCRKKKQWSMVTIKLSALYC